MWIGEIQVLSGEGVLWAMFLLLAAFVITKSWWWDRFVLPWLLTPIRRKVAEDEPVVTLGDRTVWHDPPNKT